MPEKILRDKVIVITGGGGGIGRAMALAMAREGARIVVNDLGSSVTGEGADASAATAVVEEIKAEGGAAVASLESVATYSSASKIVQCALDTFGRIDGVVNNAGILRDRMFHKMSPEEFEAVVSVHLLGSFYVSRAAATHFREQSSGNYIFMTSNSGLIGNVGQANYIAAKLGMVGLSKSIALDMKQYNVRSNCIAPAAYSRMIGSIPVDSPARQAQVDRMKRTMSPDKIAPLATFLLSDNASAVNGQIFYVRGNEIFLYGQHRAIRSVHRSEGWTPETIMEHAMPSLTPSFIPLNITRDLYNWDAV